MELVKVEVELPKQVSELADAVVAVVQATRLALKDGWQSGTDLPVILTTALAVLPKAVEGLDQLPAEVKGDKGKLVLALAVALDKVL
jgi:hypothetical protein